jgi:hypothetical protein
MRRVWVIALLTGSIRAADVTVFTTGDGIVPNAVSYGAKFQVTRMFAQIGVRLDWRDGEPSAKGRSVGSVAIRASRWFAR